VLVLTVKAIAIWLAILALAVANGVLREAVFIPWLGKSPGLVLSGILLSAVILAVTSVTLPWLGAHRLSQLIGVGLGWFVLTLAFEFSFGRFQGKSWPSMLEAYSFQDGNLWPVVLLVTALAPYLAARLRGWF
jgi:hypothetical protein